ncbi:MAG: hypothetical protein WAU38_07675, partial [Ignavibacteria bacterium]
FSTIPKKIELAFLNKKFTPEEIKLLNQKLLEYDITNTELEIKQDTKDLKGEILNELTNQDKILTEKDILINNLQKELEEYKIDNTETLKEIAILFPELKNVTMGKQIINQNTDSSKLITVILYQSDSSDNKTDTEKIIRWLNQKLQETEIKLVKQQ